MLTNQKCDIISDKCSVYTQRWALKVPYFLKKISNMSQPTITQIRVDKFTTQWLFEKIKNMTMAGNSV